MTWRKRAGVKDPWHAGDDPWKSTTASSGDESKVTHYAPCSGELIFQQMICRIGKAFRLANADLYRLQCHDYDEEINEVAQLLHGCGKRWKPYQSKSKDADSLLDLLAILALPQIPASVAKVGKGKISNYNDKDEHATAGIKGKGIFVPPPIVQTVEKIVEKVVRVPQVQVIEKVIDKSVDLEKLVEVPVVQTVQVEKIVEKIVEVRASSAAVANFECQAEERIIRAESNLIAPEAVHRKELQDKIDQHQERYPGGTLPSDLRSFSEYMQAAKNRLVHAEQAKLCCLCCGHYPWT